MKTLARILVTAGAVALTSLASSGGAATLLGWNNLGMHCMDSDYSVFSILPPYNTIEAQLVVNGKLVTNGAGYSVTYQAIADPLGSFNSTTMGKGNFYDYSAIIYGATLLPEHGLAGWDMPGLFNVPQEMLFEQTNRPAPGVATPVNWFRAEGIPIAPYDDTHQKNAYPMMRLIAWDPAARPIATNDIVLPVSDEMDCRTCHTSGTQSTTQPPDGWVWSGWPERDYRLNILRLHDAREFAAHSNLYVAALAARSFNPAGLYRSVAADGRPVLCAACHASEALGAPSYGTIPPLTASMHAFHADVLDPDLKVTLDNADHRAACYRCHPGSTTRCLRGAMGGAVASDGSMAMQCQSCHGSMKQVGSVNRVGWFMEPTCQSCHSGTATTNSGQIRYTSAFLSNGVVRVPADLTFATQPNSPAPGLSLYRFSKGHGGLQCSACHGSTHAEFPSTHLNDNVRNLSLQGHAGVMVECSACHASMPATMTGGPHGMHPTVQSWVNAHGDLLDFGATSLAQCRTCHGTDYRGTVLSRAQGDHTLTADFDAGRVTLRLYRGAIVGCYSCHSGPGSESPNSNPAPIVSNCVTNTTNDRSVPLPISVTGAGATLRILSQPAHGAVAITNGPIYIPEPGFAGTVAFTYAAYDGAKNSSPATGSVSVAQGPCALGATPLVPGTQPAKWPVPFTVVPITTNVSGTARFEWDFGDGSPRDTNRTTSHTYQIPGTYGWSVISQVTTASVTHAGSIVIREPTALAVKRTGATMTLVWPSAGGDTLLEASQTVGPGARWVAVTNRGEVLPGAMSVGVGMEGQRFYRVRQVW